MVKSVRCRAVTLFCCAVRMAAGVRGALEAQKEPLEVPGFLSTPSPSLRGGRVALNLKECLANGGISCTRRVGKVERDTLFWNLSREVAPETRPAPADSSLPCSRVGVKLAHLPGTHTSYKLAGAAEAASLGSGCPGTHEVGAPVPGDLRWPLQHLHRFSLLTGPPARQLQGLSPPAPCEQQCPPHPQGF